MLLQLGRQLCDVVEDRHWPGRGREHVLKWKAQPLQLGTLQLVLATQPAVVNIPNLRS